MTKGLGADLILRNARVITVDADFTVAGALAVLGERILAVGADTDVDALAGSATRFIDAGGKAVVPGLIDGHAHMDREGLKDVYPSLAGARSIDDVLARIESLAVQAAPGEWIVTMPVGDPPYYWDVPDILAERRFPNRWDLDTVAPDNPVYIRPIWGFWRHTLPLVSIANSRALEAAGITRATPDPSATVNIERDAAGEPTGVFIENTYIPIVELTLMRASGGFLPEDRGARAENLHAGLPRRRHHQRLRGARHRRRGFGGLQDPVGAGRADHALQSGVQPGVGCRRRYPVRHPDADVGGVAGRARTRRQPTSHGRHLYRDQYHHRQFTARPGQPLYRLVGVQLRLEPGPPAGQGVAPRGGAQRHPRQRHMARRAGALQGGKRRDTPGRPALGFRPHRGAHRRRHRCHRRHGPGAHHPHQPPYIQGGPSAARRGRRRRRDRRGAAYAR